MPLHKLRKLSVAKIKERINNLLHCLTDPILTPRDKLILEMELLKTARLLPKKGVN